MDDKFRAQPIYLLPVVATLLVGVLCVSIVLSAPVEYLYAVTPFPASTAGSFGNGLYFVVLAAVGASLLYLLLRRRKLKLVTLITGFAITAAAFLLSSVYLYAGLSIFIPNSALLALTLAVPITVLADLAIFRTSGKGYSLAILLLGGALGAFLGMSIPILSAVLILSFLAAYDVFAVYRGPVGKIAQAGLDQLRGLSLSFRDVQIGLGDLTFYSMLTALVLTNAGPVLCVASITGVVVGAFIALKMLEKKGIFPGLPFPVALGLAPLIVLLLH